MQMSFKKYHNNHSLLRCINIVIDQDTNVPNSVNLMMRTGNNPSFAQLIFCWCYWPFQINTVVLMCWIICLEGKVFIWLTNRIRNKGFIHLPSLITNWFWNTRQLIKLTLRANLLVWRTAMDRFPAVYSV